VLLIAPSTHYEHLAKRVDPARLSDRARRDEALCPEIRRVFEENSRVYGVRKIWRQLGREGFDVARCTVGRLMKGIGIQGIIRGKPHGTTIPDKKAPCPLDKVNRQFRVLAPNMLWVSDFTYVATWKGFVYVAFVIDAYARRIVGWRVSTSAHAGPRHGLSGHVWMAPAWQGGDDLLAICRVRPCIRRLVCGLPARPDERPREVRSLSMARASCALVRTGCPFLVSVSLPSSHFALAISFRPSVARS
jgi:hypothetical protein